MVSVIMPCGRPVRLSVDGIEVIKGLPLFGGTEIADGSAFERVAEMAERLEIGGDVPAALGDGQHVIDSETLGRAAI
jgi:hypothetical protein